MKTDMEVYCNIQQKIDFLKFAITILKSKENWKHTSKPFQSGLCYLYRQYFSTLKIDPNFEKVPEIRRYKPKKYFYTCTNESTYDNSKFWFPVVGDNKKRIEICERILSKLT